MDIHALETMSVPLTYSIDDSIPPSGRYVAENVLIDKPTDQNSRWSTSNTNQWITLRLQSLAIVRSITFGKYHKTHPCTMKDFKIYVGMRRDQMVEVLHASLKNDTIPEAFSLKHKDNSGLLFPTRFIKIVPLSAHGTSFNSSIWHISITGISDEAVVESVRKGYDEYRETQALRYLLKHLRQRRFLSPYHAILSCVGSSIRVEHSLVSELHSSIVLHGDWTKAEEILHQMSSANLFSSYLERQRPHAVWTKLRDGPSSRGGHAMCMDHPNGMIYLFGGWDGQKNLDDFWVYDVRKEEWRVLPCGSDAPSPRSCHKMVYNAKLRCIYVLGRLVEPEGNPKGTQNGAANGSASSSTLSAEFYRYHIESEKWESLKYDSAVSGGPPLLYDHQMVMDNEKQIIYVSGGMVVNLSGDLNIHRYSGLFAYDVERNKWSLLPNAETFTSRSGHAMVLDSNTQTLYILFGQQREKYLSDVYSYHIPTNTTELALGPGPEPSSTALAAINPELKEISVYTHSEQSSSTLFIDSPIWIYRYGNREKGCISKWMQILPSSDEVPEPRFAHDIVYDHGTGTLYMFGGKTSVGKESESDKENQESSGSTATAKDEKKGTIKEPMVRLDDFWALKVERPSWKEVIRRATFYLREQQFKEMCSSPIPALAYLQKEVSSVVNHSDPEEAESFRSLLTHLLSSGSPPSSPYLDQRDVDEDEPPPRKRSRSNAADGKPSTITSLASVMRRLPDPLEPSTQEELSEETFTLRNEVFEKILEFVNEDGKQTAGSLVDLFGVNVDPSP